MTRPITILAVLAIAVAVAGCAGSATSSGTQPATAASPVITAAPVGTLASLTPIVPTASAATGAATPSLAPSPPSPAASASSALPEGTYSTGPLQVTAIAAAIKAAGQDPSGWDFGAVKTFAFTLKFESGTIVFFDSEDGGPFKVGWQGTFTLLDDHTLVATYTGSPPAVQTYHFAVVGDKLAMHFVSDTETDAFELAHAAGIYNTAPFIRQATAEAPSLAPSASTSAASSALPEGTYRTAPIPAAKLLATVKAAGQDPTQVFEVGTYKAVVFSIKFQAGAMVLFFSHDGGADLVGWTGTYTVPDDHTLVATYTGSPPAVQTFNFTLVGTKLTLHFVSDTETDAFEMANVVGIYGTAPFIWQP